MSEDYTWAWERHVGYDDRGYEQRQACITLIECPRCAATVELVGDSTAWELGDDGRWHHTEYGPPTGECCGWLFVDDPWQGVRVYRLPKEAQPQAGPEEAR